MSVRFQATVYRYGDHARLDIPQEISRLFDDKGYIPVTGTMNGKGIRGTLMPMTGRRHVLYVNHQMARRAGINVGDTVTLDLDRDLTVRKPLPQELADALEADPIAKSAWECADPSYRKRTIALLAWFTSPKSRERRIAKVLRDLQRMV